MLCSAVAITTITDDNLTMSKTQDRNKTQDKTQAALSNWVLCSLGNIAHFLRKKVQLSIKI